MNFKNLILACTLLSFVASTMPASPEVAEISITEPEETTSITEKVCLGMGIALICAAFYSVATADSESLIKLAERN